MDFPENTAKRCSLLSKIQYFFGGKQNSCAKNLRPQNQQFLSLSEMPKREILARIIIGSHLHVTLRSSSLIQLRRTRDRHCCP